MNKYSPVADGLYYGFYMDGTAEKMKVVKCINGILFLQNFSNKKWEAGPIDISCFFALVPYSEGLKLIQAYGIRPNE